MCSRITTAVCAVVALQQATRLQGQSADSALLAIPTHDTIQCRYTVGSERAGRDSTDIRLRLQVGRDVYPTARTIEAWYDSSGRSLWLNEQDISPVGTAGVRIESLLAMFSRSGDVTGVILTKQASRGDRSPPSSDSAIGTLKPKRLTAQQQQAARALSTWIWQHKCRRTTGQ